MRRLFLGIFVLLGSFGFCLPLWADTPPTKVSAFDSMGIQLPALQRSTGRSRRMYNLIHEWHKLWTKSRSSRAKAVLKDLHQLRLNLGYPNLISFSSVLLKQGEKEDKEGNSARAKYLYEQAGLFSPSVPASYYRLSWLTVRSEPTKVYLATKFLIKGLKLQRFDLFGLSVFVVGLAWFLAWILGFAFLLFWVVLLLRSLRTFQSDFRDLFPDGVTSFQIQLLSLFLIFLPLLMGAGILETLLCWVLISWFYQTRGERILTTFGLLLLSITPYAANWVGSFASLSGSSLESVYLLNETELGRKRVRRLQKLAAKSGDEVLLWSLGLHFKRMGMLKKARYYYKRAYKKKRNPGLLINIANLDFIEQKAESAYNRYRKALRKRGLPEGQYNLSLIYQHSSSTEVVPFKVDALTAARRGGGERIEAFMKQSKQHINRYVMDVFVPRSYYFREYFSLPNHTGLQQRFWSYAATWLPLSTAPWVGLGMVIFLWLIFPFGRKFFCGNPCTRCGRVVGRREQKNGAEDGECTQCHQLTAKTEGVSAERRVKKELEIQRFKRRRTSIMYLSVAFMGVGQLVLKKSGKAFSLFMLLATVIFLWLFPAPVLVHPFLFGTSDYFLVAVGVSIVACFSYVRGIREVLSNR